MDSEKYVATQQQILVLAALVIRMPLAEFLNAISMADTAGPIIDPTLYRQGAPNMHRVESLARAAKEFQDELRGIYERDEELKAALEKIDRECEGDEEVEKQCRICGCTEEAPCFLDGRPCSWVEEDLCSNPECVAAAGHEYA